MTGSTADPPVHGWLTQVRSTKEPSRPLVHHVRTASVTAYTGISPARRMGSKCRSLDTRTAPSRKQVAAWSGSAMSAAAKYGAHADRTRSSTRTISMRFSRADRSAYAVGDGKTSAYRRYSSAKTSLPTRRKSDRSRRRTSRRNVAVWRAGSLIADTRTFVEDVRGPREGHPFSPRRLSPAVDGISLRGEAAHLRPHPRDEGAQVHPFEFLRVEPLQPQSALGPLDEEELRPCPDSVSRGVISRCQWYRASPRRTEPCDRHGRP